MEDYRERFKKCGENVVIEPNVHIEHPEVMEVGDNVKFMRNFVMMDCPASCKIGNDVSFFPGFFCQGAGNLVVEDEVIFYTNTYVSLGGPEGLVRVGHKSHFAPFCILYGGGRLDIGPYCNIAAHTVFATIGHDPAPADEPMCRRKGLNGPITLVEDVWVAANCTIVWHTKIEKGCIVGANSVVTHDTEPYGIYMGAPARRVKDRFPPGD